MPRARQPKVGSNRGNAGKGRKPGVPNHTTRDVRKAIAHLAERNVGRVQGWLDEVAKDEPARALEIFSRLLEYHIPRLARAEVTGKDSAPLNFLVLVPPKTTDASAGKC